MKILVCVFLIIVSFYYFKPELFSNIPGFGFNVSDENSVELFTYTNCGQYCDEARSVLNTKGVAFDEFNIHADAFNEKHWKKRGGGDRFPTVFVGNDRVEGFNRQVLTHALAKSFGVDVLDSPQRSVVQKHIDTYGANQVVMYGTVWCPYCKKAREYFNDKGMAFIEIDAEKSSEGARDYKALAGTGYPLIYVGVHRFAGFDNRVKKGINKLF